METELTFKLPLRFWMKCSAVISIGWLIYTIPRAINFASSLDAKLNAFAFAIAGGAFILMFGLSCELINNEIKKRLNEQRRRFD